MVLMVNTPPSLASIASIPLLTMLKNTCQQLIAIATHAGSTDSNCRSMRDFEERKSSARNCTALVTTVLMSAESAPWHLPRKSEQVGYQCLGAPRLIANFSGRDSRLFRQRWVIGQQSENPRIAAKGC